MKTKNLLKSSAGFTMVEIMVAVALLGAVSLGVVKLMDNSQKAAKNIENKDEISQLQNEINDILKNPNNCEAALGERTLNSTVPIIYQVINGVKTPKYTASTAPSNKVSIQSMRIKSVDDNGSNGSQALAILEISFKKPSANQMGGQVLNKEIKVNANFCRKDIIQSADFQTMMNSCKGPNRRLIEGPHVWNGQNWGVCQDCNNASAKIINFCQSLGSGGGVDVGSVSKLACLNMGGIYIDETSTCNVDDSTAKISCASLGGEYNATSKKCLFDTKTLIELIQSRVDALKDTLPSSIVDTTPTTCPPGSVYSLTIVGGKIKMNCAPPPACTGCASWGNWSGYSATPICDGGHGWGEGGHKGDEWRVNCHYQRTCSSKLPVGCVGAVNETKYNWCNTDTCSEWNKLSNCEENGPGMCPPGPWW